ncbi:BamA/TamA family outer membrane protein [Cytophagaceae bacterium DM2B3-1]|uniref:BamA/TamA family outer membrane protein n=1 Tax=Xanthocytophaga flava TaxID=3048013 RepID=A0ABT7CFI7_9BACT|nr:BamA/TamA family outer membrane protein [Xanthocytophaga flavus]MDJ1466499.1 BamA/TamA family outer membrane protein [Xanthocytophaga flavus]MDJ1492496.1 BamA/TamA family outer membrane protein [Xanthocytophaga flavus]
MLVYLFSLWLSLSSCSTQALPATSIPDEPFLVIHTIHIEGNKKTNAAVIMRELDIAPGDTLPGSQIDLVLKRNKNKIFNTNLFNSVELLLQPNEFGNIDLVIQVAERWYIFPMVILELGDRNFNEWWSERGRDLRRLNYGLRIAHKNVFGNGEELRAVAQFGFTKRFDLAYTIRNLDKARKNGLGFLVSYSTNKNMAYQTEGNKLEFLNTNEVMRERFFTSVRFSRRPQFYNQHSIEGRFHYNTISDSIAKLNPDYFLHGQTRQHYFQLSYEFVNDRRDLVAYPLRGHYFEVELTRAGLLPADNFDKTSLRVNFALYRPIGRKFFWNMNIQGMTSYPSLQPYAQYRALGFGFEYLRGYERYIVDGQHFGFAKFTFKRELLSTEVSIPGFRIQQFSTIPISLYLTTFGDFGYVVDPTNNPGNSLLANKLIYSTGAGIDIVTFYNVVMRFNYAINRLGDKGIFFNFVRDI